MEQNQSDNFGTMVQSPVLVEQMLDWKEFKSMAWKVGSVGAVLGMGAFMATRYRVCQPHQYMVRTGLGITNMAVSKSGFVYPFQKATILSMNPKTYTFA